MVKQKWADKYFVRQDNSQPVLTRLVLVKGRGQIERFRDGKWVYDHSLSKLDINPPLVGREITKAEADRYIQNIGDARRS